MRRSAPTITTFRFYTTMQNIRGRREQTTEKLDNYLGDMGYA